MREENYYIVIASQALGHKYVISYHPIYVSDISVLRSLGENSKIHNLFPFLRILIVTR